MSSRLTSFQEEGGQSYGPTFSVQVSGSCVALVSEGSLECPQCFSQLARRSHQLINGISEMSGINLLMGH